VRVQQCIPDPAQIIFFCLQLDSSWPPFGTKTTQSMHAALGDLSNATQVVLRPPSRFEANVSHSLPVSTGLGARRPAATRDATTINCGVRLLLPERSWKKACPGPPHVTLRDSAGPGARMIIHSQPMNDLLRARQGSRTTSSWCSHKACAGFASKYYMPKQRIASYNPVLMSKYQDLPIQSCYSVS
jgi:hypothetical protein